MPETVGVPTTSRRRLLAAAPALVLPGAAVAAGAASNPDAELVGLCADLDAIERRTDALFDHARSGLTFEEADAAAQVIEVDQFPLVGRVCALTPATDEGLMAVARSLALLSPDYGDPDLYARGTMDERLAHVIVRGMMGRAGA